MPRRVPLYCLADSLLDPETGLNPCSQHYATYTDAILHFQHGLLLRCNRQILWPPKLLPSYWPVASTLPHILCDLFPETFHNVRNQNWNLLQNANPIDRLSTSQRSDLVANTNPCLKRGSRNSTGVRAKSLYGESRKKIAGSLRRTEPPRIRAFFQSAQMV
jgi:hypothetical protein